MVICLSLIVLSSPLYGFVPGGLALLPQFSTDTSGPQQSLSVTAITLRNSWSWSRYCTDSLEDATTRPTVTITVIALPHTAQLTRSRSRLLALLARLCVAGCLTFRLLAHLGRLRFQQINLWGVTYAPYLIKYCLIDLITSLTSACPINWTLNWR